VNWAAAQLVMSDMTSINWSRAGRLGSAMSAWHDAETYFRRRAKGGNAFDMAIPGIGQVLFAAYRDGIREFLKIPTSTCRDTVGARVKGWLVQFDRFSIAGMVALAVIAAGCSSGGSTSSQSPSSSPSAAQSKPKKARGAADTLEKYSPPTR
jgi:hypothetical protein